MKKSKVQKLVPGAICSDCAQKFKLVWPKGHCATFWMGECSQCGQEKSCCSTGDYNHPSGGKVSGMRD